MATILRIDPDDELPSIIERLSPHADCIVVLPPHAHALNSSVAAKLLYRRAAALDSNVAVVTADTAVMAHARAAGVVVADSVDEAKRLLGSDLHREPTAPLALPATRTHPGDGDAPVASAPSVRTVADAPDPAGTVDADSEPSPGADRAVFTAGATARGADAPTHSPETGARRTPAPNGSGATASRAPSSGPAAGSASSAGRAGSAQRAPGSGPMPRAHAPKAAISGPRRLLTPTVLVVAPLLVLGWLAFYVLSGLLNPSATLTIRPRASIITGTTTVRAVLNLPPSKRGAYAVAMARLNQPERATVGVPVRGIKLVPDHVATGEVWLANTTSRPLLVPRGTAFSTALNKAVFVSTRDITLPAATLTFTSSVYGFGTVPIRAVSGGTGGNVGVGAIDNVAASLSGTVPSPSGAINVRNPVPTTGGTDKRVRVVDPHDLARTAARLLGALKQQALQDVARRFNGDAEAAIVAVDTSPVAARLAPSHRTATLTLSIVAHIDYVHRHDLMPAATAALQPAIQTHPAGSFIPGSIGWSANWTPVRPVTATTSWDPTTAATQSIALAVSGHVRAPLDTAALLHAISGQSRTAAIAYLRRQSDVAYADISLSPPWADQVPADVTRIHVNPLPAQ